MGQCVSTCVLIRLTRRSAHYHAYQNLSLHVGNLVHTCEALQEDEPFLGSWPCQPATPFPITLGLKCQVPIATATATEVYEHPIVQSAAGIPAIVCNNAVASGNFSSGLSPMQQCEQAGAQPFRTGLWHRLGRCPVRGNAKSIIVQTHKNYSADATLSR